MRRSQGGRDRGREAARKKEIKKERHSIKEQGRKESCPTSKLSYNEEKKLTRNTHIFLQGEDEKIRHADKREKGETRGRVGTGISP